MKFNLLLCVFLFIFCVKNTIFESKSIAQHIIDVDLVNKEKEIYASSIFESVRAIILEETDDAVIGIISDIQVCDDYIFVSDNRARNLFMFDKNGKFIRKIGRLGAGSEEYLSIYDFCIDKERKEIYILDSEKYKIHKYNFETGKYINSIETMPSKSKTAAPFYILYNNNNIYTKLLYTETSENNNLLMKIDISTNERTTYLNSKKYNLGWNKQEFNAFNVFSLKLDNIPKYVDRMMNTIMAIGRDSIYAYITLKNKNWVQQADILQDTPNTPNIPVSRYLDEKKRAHDIYNYMEWGNYVFFEFVQSPKENCILYNTETKEIKYGESFVNDLVYSKDKGMSPNFRFANSNAAYEIFDIPFLSRLKMFERNTLVFSQNLDDKKDELMNLLKEGERYAIFEYKFK